jgi:chromosome segregation ATPase
MALINQDLVSSIAASLVPQVPSISSSTGTTIEKPVESAIENLSEKSTEISQLEQRIGDYEQRIEALKVEKDGLVNSIASIEKELADANVRVEELTMSNANLQDSLGTSNATIADLRAAKESSEASSISKIATLTTSVETLTDNINGLRSDISVKDGEISELREKLSISEAEAVAKMKLEERNQALESKNEEFTARIFFLETLASEVTEKSSLVAALQKEIKALQDGAADLEMNQADLEQKLNDKSQHIQDLEANRALLEKELSELKRRQAEDLNIRYVETARLNEEITKNAEALHLERQKFQVLSEKCLDFERIASANSKLVDEGDKQIQTFKTEIGILHGKLAEAVETIERLKETNEFQQFEVSAKVKHIGDMESQLSKMKQALEESNAKLFSLQDDIARRVLEESAVRDQNEQLRNQLAGLMRERDENRKASELAELQASKLAKDLADLQKVVENTTLKWTTAEQQLEQMAKEAERKNAEMGQLTKRLHEMQEFSSSFSDLKAELDRANEKLSKQDEKKKRDLENLKKQNELIAKVNREKDELERNLNRTISDLNLQLQDLTSSKFTLELALKESETARAAAGVEIDELRMKLSLAGDSTILSTSADDNKVTCSECVALKEALDASNQALKKEVIG